MRWSIASQTRECLNDRAPAILEVMHARTDDWLPHSHTVSVCVTHSTGSEEPHSRMHALDRWPSGQNTDLDWTIERRSGARNHIGYTRARNKKARHYPALHAGGLLAQSLTNTYQVPT